MKWINASERLPEVDGHSKCSKKLHLKFYGEADTGYYYAQRHRTDKAFFSGQKHGILYIIYFDQIEWLDETPVPVKSEDLWDDVVTIVAGSWSREKIIADLKSKYSITRKP